MSDQREQLRQLGLTSVDAAAAVELSIQAARGTQPSTALWAFVDPLTECMTVATKDRVEDCLYSLMRADRQEHEQQALYWESIRILAGRLRPCDRCGGNGRMSLFKHTEGGRCFLCNGPGFFLERKRLVPDEVMAFLGNRASDSPYSWGEQPLGQDLSPYRQYIEVEMRRYTTWTPPWIVAPASANMRNDLLKVLDVELGACRENNSLMESFTQKLKTSAQPSKEYELYTSPPVPTPQDELIAIGLTREDAIALVTLAREERRSIADQRAYIDLLGERLASLPPEQKSTAKRVFERAELLAAMHRFRKSR